MKSSIHYITTLYIYIYIYILIIGFNWLQVTMVRHLEVVVYIATYIVGVCSEELKRRPFSIIIVIIIIIIIVIIDILRIHFKYFYIYLI